MTQYIKLKYDLLQEHNVFERMQRLDHPGNRNEYAERMDKDILSASLAAEKQIKRYASPAWSLELVAARKKVTYWSICISMLTSAGVIAKATGRLAIEYQT